MRYGSRGGREGVAARLLLFLGVRLYIAVVARVTQLGIGSVWLFVLLLHRQISSRFVLARSNDLLVSSISLLSLEFAICFVTLDCELDSL